jgi:hypothetical protein
LGVGESGASGENAADEAQGSGRSTSVFTGDVASFATVQESIFELDAAALEAEENRFKWKPFFIGFLLIPILVGAAMGGLVGVSEFGANGNYYGWDDDLVAGDDVEIDGHTYRTWTADYDLRVDPDPEEDEWFYTSINFRSDSQWIYCWLDIERASINIDDSGVSWREMNCSEDFRYRTQVSFEDDKFTYATESTKTPEQASVDGQKRVDWEFELILNLTPIILFLGYPAVMIGAFIKSRKELGIGMVVGIAPAFIAYWMTFVLMAMMNDNF